MKYKLSGVKYILRVALICNGLWAMAQQADSVYVFSYFKNNGKDGLHMAYSKDGLKWKALKEDTSFLAPELGNEKLMRDPCVVQGADGKYYMVWTVGWTEKGIGLASSEDLIHWSKQAYIPVMEHEQEARNCWAPEITYDSTTKMYMIYWATTITGKFTETQTDAEKSYNHRMYYTLTKDFKSFTPAKLLYDPGFNIIDATIYRLGAKKYLMFYKDETREPKTEKNIHIAYSEQITGPYHTDHTPITGNYWAEGPTAVKIGGKWIVYFDKYTNHSFGAVSSTDLKTWTDISDQIELPEGIRHGTVIKIPNSIAEKLMKE